MMLRNGDTHRDCKACGKTRRLESFRKQGRSRICRDCENGRRQDRKRHKARLSLEVVEVIGSRKFHVAERGAAKTYCRCGNVVPVVHGNGLAMLAGLISDPACCSTCRSKLEAVFGE